MKIRILLLGAALIVTRPVFASSEETCQIQAGLLKGAALMRDQGWPKSKAMKEISRKMATVKGWGKSEESGLEWYVDMVYGDMRNMSPDKVAEISYVSCRQS